LHVEGKAAGTDGYCSEPDRDLLIAALAIDRIGCLTATEKLRLFDRTADVEAVAGLTPCAVQAVSSRRLRAIPEGPGRFLADAERERSRLTQLGGGCILYGSGTYPPLLTAIYDPPFLLYYRGNYPELLCTAEHLSVVGTRRPSGAGRRAAFEMGFHAARRGATVVSGLARGVDAEAHRGCLAAGGRTVAVLGTGVDTIYPASSVSVARALIASGGLLLSEYRLGTQPRRHHFPSRNRIISGLSTTLVVIQAPAGSGALITAEHALDQGREVLVHAAGLGAAVCSAGSAALAADGAPVINPAARAHAGSSGGRRHDAAVGRRLSQSLRSELAGAGPCCYGGADG
jgi:DNA processing protein